MEQGWDPDVKRFFLKIINTISMGILWLMVQGTAGLYFGLAFTGGKPVIVVVLYYVVLVVSFLLLLKYFLRIWKNGIDAGEKN